MLHTTALALSTHISFWVVALVHFVPLLISHCNVQTLGSQGIDILVIVFGVVLVIRSMEINVYQARVQLLVGHDGTHNLRIVLEEHALVQIQVLEVCHGSDGIAEQLQVVAAIGPPGVVETASKVSDCGQALAVNQRLHHRSTLVLILINTDTIEIKVADLRVGGQD